AKYYPGGFTNTSRAIGSTYHAPAGATGGLLDLTNALVAFEGGDLAMAFTNAVRFQAGNTVFNASSNPLALKFVPQTGLWKGTVTEPTTGRSFSFQGAVLQRQNSGRGFFLGTNQSGRVRLQPD